MAEQGLPAQLNALDWQVRTDLLQANPRLLAVLFLLWDERQQARGERSDIDLLFAFLEEQYGRTPWPLTSMVHNLRQRALDGSGQGALLERR